MIKEIIRQQVTKAVESLVKEGQIRESSLGLVQSMIIGHPKDKNHGDFSLNIAMLIGKSEQKPAILIAQKIEPLLSAASTHFNKVEIAGPGFINLSLSQAALALIINHIFVQGQSYGRQLPKKKQRALVEFVSANPTGGLHLGHARGAFVGDAIARLLDVAGYQVTKEYYVNDAGSQVETLARTIFKRYEELFGYTVRIEPGEYPGEYVKEIAEALKDYYGDRFLQKKEDEWLMPIMKFGVEYNLALIKRSLHAADIEIDEWYSEQSLHDKGELLRVLEAYDARRMLYEAELAKGSDEKVRRKESKASQFAHLQAGGTFLKTSLFGDEEDRIIRRSDGRFVYLTADLAYHHEKFERGYDLLVDVFGADHAGHIGRIRAGMSALGHNTKNLHFVVVQMVRLLKGGQEIKFSKRAGQVVGLDDLIEEVGKDVARFVFLMRSPNAQFDLDIDAVTERSHENPVFYVQYGHARMATILTRAKEAGFTVEGSPFGPNHQALLVLPEERDLIVRMGELPDVVMDAAKVLEPHRLVIFCQELVRTFHSYFTKYRHSEKIISSDLEKTQARLMLVFAVKLTIFNALSFLGISAPEYMEQNVEIEDG